MSRWIDANKLIEFINSKFVVSWKHDYDGGFKDACVEILNAIEDAPTIEIIRCSECKYASDNKVYGCMLNHFNDNDYDYHRMYANDFCSRGERKDDE